jgi:predicted nucleic acid-binding protein
MAMSEQLWRCVIDANVALKVYQQQPGLEKADALFDLLDAEPQAQFYVPDLFYAECTNAFAQYGRLTGYPADAARADILDLRALTLRVVPTADLADAALEIALKHLISGYDACYVALAQQVNAPLITADTKLMRALAGKRLPVQSLETVDLPRPRP